MLRFSLWLLGALMIASTFLSLVLTGALSGNGSFLIGWFACGIYSVVMFCGIGGEPENQSGTSFIMILGGAIVLLIVLGLAADFEIRIRPNHKLVYRPGRGYVYVPKPDLYSWE